MYEDTYNKILKAAADGKQIIPADIYKLDKYWEMQAQLKSELERLGDSQIEAFSKAFVEQYKGIYDLIDIPELDLPSEVFQKLSEANASQALNSVWCADGKNWSQRVWENTGELLEALNNELVTSAITGAKTSELKKALMERFNVSFSRADTLVRTEMAHLQTEAAAQRYKDYGLKYYKFCADADKRTCEECAALDGKQFLLSEKQVGVNCPPIHPNDRCCIIPVVE